MSILFVLSACGGNTVATQEEDLVAVAYTDAAMTLSAQMPTSTPSLTVTPLPSIIPTLYIPPTFAEAASPTEQNAASYVSYSTANGCNDAVYVSDVTIPDGTVLAPGELFTKTWEFQNTGTCDWSEDYLIIFSNGTEMDGESTTIDRAVSVSSVGDISASLVAPDTEGTYIGYWRMADSDGNLFGESVYVMIVVSDSASTPTPTPTSTSEVTSTPTSTTITSTPTSAPTSTPQAADTFTPTPIPTSTPTNTEIPTPTDTPSS